MRWNLNKRGGSLSLGGRGFHHILGGRTTLGIPGTGLSYIWGGGKSRRKGAASRSHPTIRVPQSVTHAPFPHTFQLPPATIGDPSITEEQVRVIHTLGKFNQADVLSLSKSQAQAVIQEASRVTEKEVTRRKDDYVESKTPHTLASFLNPTSHHPLEVITALIGALILWLVIHACMAPKDYSKYFQTPSPTGDTHEPPPMPSTPPLIPQGNRS
jgi:hypothetical protein